MSKEKQIEEMARHICERSDDDVCTLDRKKCDCKCTSGSISELLYDRGYRKQIEGEWKRVYDKAPRFVCTACNHLYNNKGFKFCPNCGAKMTRKEDGKNE